MNDAARDAIREHVAAWRRAAPVLQQVRDEDIRHAKTPAALQSFAGSALWAAEHRNLSATSGLIEQQRWFAKIHGA
jgi:hypothetical protein